MYSQLSRFKTKTPWHKYRGLKMYKKNEDLIVASIENSLYLILLFETVRIIKNETTLSEYK